MIEPSSDQLDALQELITIGVGRAASSLSDMVGQRVDLTVPYLRRVTDAGQCLFGQGGSLAVVEQAFSGAMQGAALLAVERDSAATLVNLLTGGALAPDELAAEQESVLTEAGNILINGVVGSLTNQTGERVEFALPEFFQCEESELRRQILERGSELVVIEIDFTIRSHRISGSVALVFEVGTLDHLMTVIDRLINDG